MRAGINRICSAAACVGVVFLFAASAHAGEVRMECPLTHPQMPDVRLRSGECMPGGLSPWSWRPDQVIDHGNGVRTDVNIYRRNTIDSLLRRAMIECNYGHYKDKITIFVPVPGALLRCGIKYYLPDLEKLKPGESGDPQVREVWAISETDDKPAPPRQEP